MEKVSKNKGVLEWIACPDCEVEAKGWPAVMIIICCFLVFAETSISLIRSAIQYFGV